MQAPVKDQVEQAGPLVKEELEARLREAQEKLQQLDERVRDKPDLGPGKGSAMGYSWEMTLARRRRVVARIEALRKALARVRERTYGYCDRCGRQIEPERLEILSTTMLCATCARTRKRARAFA